MKIVSVFIEFMTMRKWQIRRRTSDDKSQDPDSKELSEKIDSVREYRHKRVSSRRIPSKSLSYSFDEKN